MCGEGGGRDPKVGAVVRLGHGDVCGYFSWGNTPGSANFRILKKSSGCSFLLIYFAIKQENKKMR